MRTLHNQFPTAELTWQEYETALVHMSEQIGAQLSTTYRSMSVACGLAEVALADTYQVRADQTVLDWIRAACAAVGASAEACTGL
jgi:hypothetical protein